MIRARGILLLLLAGCDGASSDSGLSASMRVSGASFFEGAMPGDSGGPNVVAVDLSSNAAHAGEIEKPLGGALDPRATAAAIGLSADTGYWVVPAGLPAVAAPKFPTFGVSLSFSPDLASGPYALLVRAVDAEDWFGPLDTEPLTVSGAPVPVGELVISLRWDTESDLDLHVVDPAGVEVWKGNINSVEPPPPGQPVDPNAWKVGGLLDFDSNAACVIDGRRQENVIWQQPPPAGHYLVRVDTASLCAASFANWVVEARYHGMLLGHAAGQAGVADAEAPHDRGAGVLALAFDVP